MWHDYEHHSYSITLTGLWELVQHPEGPKLIDELEYSLEIRVNVEYLEC